MQLVRQADLIHGHDLTPLLVAQHEHYNTSRVLRSCLAPKVQQPALSQSQDSSDDDDMAGDGSGDSPNGRVGLSNLGNTCVISRPLFASWCAPCTSHMAACLACAVGAS